MVATGGGERRERRESAGGGRGPSGKYGAGACKYSHIQKYLASGQIHLKYIRGLLPRTRFKYSQIHMYLVSGQIPNTKYGKLIYVFPI